MKRKRFPSGRAKKIKLLIMDVDGVLTDGKIIIGSSGEEFKHFHVLDGAGIHLALKAGLKIAIISGRKSAATRIRAGELGISELWQVESKKEKVYEKLLKKYNLVDSEIAYIGDDVFDIEIMKRAGLAIAVSNAVDEVKLTAHYITKKAGGYGAVREVIDFILRAWKKRILSLISIIFLVSTLLMGSCAKKTIPQKVKPAHVEAGERVESGFSYTATDAGKVIFEVKGERATGLTGNALHIEKPEVEWHSANGPVTVGSDEGTLTRETKDVFFEGNVSVASDRGRMTCDKLSWSASEKKMTAQGNAKGEFYLR